MACLRYELGLRGTPAEVVKQAAAMLGEDAKTAGLSTNAIADHCLKVALSHPRGTSPAVTSEEAQAAAQRYLEHDEVWAALEGDGGKESERPVRLVRLSWLLALGQPGSSVHRKYGGVLPRRQELPEAAFIGVDELQEISRQAKRGVDFFLVFEMAVLEMQLGEGNPFKRVLRMLFQFLSCKFVKRNVDELLPIVAVS